MAGEMRASTSRFMVTLALYAPYRVMGATPRQALEAINQGGSLVDASAAELASVANKDNAAADAVVNKVATAVGTVGAVVGCIPAGVTQLAGAVIGIAAALIKGLCAIFNVPADRYGFPKGSIDYYRRAVIGLSPPPGAIISAQDSNYMGYRGDLSHMMHDGYIANIPSASDPDLMTGRIQGVVAKGDGSAANIWKFWAKQYSPPGMTQPEFDRRAKDVRNILKWAEDRLEQRQLKMMDDILDEGTRDSRRKRGSIWYASLYLMCADLYDACKAVGWQQAAARATALNYKQTAKLLPNYARGLPQGETVAGYAILSLLNYDEMYRFLYELSNGIPLSAYRYANRPAAVAKKIMTLAPAKVSAEEFFEFATATAAPQTPVRIAPQTLTAVDSVTFATAAPTATAATPAPAPAPAPAPTVAPATPAAPTAPTGTSSAVILGAAAMGLGAVWLLTRPKK